jgi:hypothetical protein
VPAVPQMSQKEVMGPRKTCGSADVSNCRNRDQSGGRPTDAVKPRQVHRERPRMRRDAATTLPAGTPRLDSASRLDQRTSQYSRWTSPHVGLPIKDRHSSKSSNPFQAGLPEGHDSSDWPSPEPPGRFDWESGPLAGVRLTSARHLSAFRSRHIRQADLLKRRGGLARSEYSRRRHFFFPQLIPGMDSSRRTDRIRNGWVRRGTLPSNPFSSRCLVPSNHAETY